MNYTTLFLLLGYYLMSSLSYAQPADWDLDADAMPDYWEFFRGLNPDDPTDAWTDLDQDGYCNLYEYELGSDPQDPLQPITLEFDGTTSITAAIKEAPRGSVLRIPTGRYALNITHPEFEEAPRMMIEGGWNEDFTIRNYCQFPTLFYSSKDSPIMSYRLWEGNSGALIIDGITFEASTNSAISYQGIISKVQLTVANCSFTGHQPSRFSSVIDVSDGPFSLITDFIIVNTLIAQNKGSAIKGLIHANKANFKILHSVIADNQASTNDSPPFRSGYGFSLSTKTDTAATIQITNNIFWDNAKADIHIDEIEQNALILEHEHNNYQQIEITPTYSYLPSPTNRSIEPRFVDTDAGNYHIIPESQLRNIGGVTGITLTGQPIDLGLLPCPENNLTTSLIKTDQMPVEVYPNPSQGSFTFSFHCSQPAVFEVSLWDINGNRVWEHSLGYIMPGTFVQKMVYNGLQTGVYSLIIQGEEFVLYNKKVCIH